MIRLTEGREGARDRCSSAHRNLASVRTKSYSLRPPVYTRLRPLFTEKKEKTFTRPTSLFYLKNALHKDAIFI